MISNWQKLADKKSLELRTAKQMLKAERKSLAGAKQTLQDCLEAQQVIQGMAAAIQTTVHNRIATIVTRCLQTVFDEPYEFKILFEQKRGKTEARFVVLNDGRETDPVSAEGGSLVDMAAFALRLAALTLTRPKPRKLIVADEPFRFVEAARIPRVRELILTLAKELGFQFIIVTHDPALHAGKVIDVG